MLPRCPGTLLSMENYTDAGLSLHTDRGSVKIIQGGKGKSETPMLLANVLYAGGFEDTTDHDCRVHCGQRRLVAPGLAATSVLGSWSFRLVANPSSPSPSSCIGAMLFTKAAISAIQVCAGSQHKPMQGTAQQSQDYADTSTDLNTTSVRKMVSLSTCNSAHRCPLQRSDPPAPRMSTR